MQPTRHAVTKESKKKRKKVGGGELEKAACGFHAALSSSPLLQPLPPLYPPSPMSCGPPNLSSSCVVFAGVAGDDVAGGRRDGGWGHSSLLIVVEPAVGWPRCGHLPGCSVVAVGGHAVVVVVLGKNFHVGVLVS